MSDARKITLQFPSLRAFLAEYGERISPEGMLLRGVAPPAAGSTVDIEVVVAEGMRLLRARGETLWSGAAGPGSGRQAAAVRFRDLDDASRTLIAKIVEQRQREGAEPFRLEDVPSPRQARLRDLTVPAAAVSAEAEEPEGPVADAIFDLAAPPPDAAADLLAPPAAPRRPEAPVPHTADPEPAPFDLGPAPAAPAPAEPGAGPVAATPDPATADPAGAGVAAEADLNDLFGGGKPQPEPARSRTEAFPASFVDEVEAELLAVEPVDSSFLDVDTSELEIQLGGPVDEPEADAAPRAEAAPPLDEPVAQAPVPEVPPPSEPAAQAPVPETPQPSQPDGEDQDVPAAAPAGGAETRPEPPPRVVEAVESAPPAGIDLGVAPESAIEEDPKATPAATAEAGRRAPEAAAATGRPGPEAAAAAAPPPDLARRVAEAFDAAGGRETVEIPVIEPPAAPSAGRARPPRAAPPPPGITPPPPASPPPEPGPSTQEPPAAAPMDDNLLSIPELHADAPPPAAEPAAQAPLPSSAESLRGAAGGSRHLGTWLLIALLAVALGIAGYFLWGLTQKDDAIAAPAGRPGTPAAPPARLPAEPAATGDETETGPALADGGGPVGEEPAASPAVEGGAEAAPADEPAVPAEATPAPPAPAAEPAAPLTGLDRITWNETGDETLMALVGDGTIARQSVDLVTIGGAQPRLVIKLAGVQRAFQPALLEVGTSHVDRVRTGLHAGGELHVVVDLTGTGVAVRDLAVRGARVELRLGSE